LAGPQDRAGLRIVRNSGASWPAGIGHYFAAPGPVVV